MIAVSHAECPLNRSARLEAVEGKGSAVSLRDWGDVQKFLESRQLAHVARARLKAAFQLAHPAFQFSAEAWPYQDSGQCVARCGNA
jgi:hypothetical protein